MKPTRRGLRKQLEAIGDVHARLAVTGGVPGWTQLDHRKVVFLVQVIMRTASEVGGIREATRMFVTQMRDEDEAAPDYLVRALEGKVDLSGTDETSHARIDLRAIYHEQRAPGDRPDNHYNMEWSGEGPTLKQRGRINPQALQTFVRKTNGEAGMPICGGPAKITEIDRVLIQRIPGRPPLTALEADFIATRTGIYYVTPYAGTMYGWKWNDAIRRVRRGKKAWKFGAVYIDLVPGRPGPALRPDEIEMEIPAALMDPLVAVASFFLKPDQDHPDRAI